MEKAEETGYHFGKMKGQEVICLYYHRVSPVKEEYSMEPGLFQSQLETLLSRGYRSILIAELMDFLAGKPLAEKKPVLLSFDDGFVDFYFNVYPVLKKYQMRAVVFLVTDWVSEDESGGKSGIPAELSGLDADLAIKSALRGDRRLFLSWGMAKEMAESGLVEFGSHSVSHRIGFRSGLVKRYILSDDAYWKYLQIYNDRVKPGLPIFQKASALTIRRFLPAPKVLDQLTGYFQKEMASSAKSQKRLESGLMELAEKIKPLGDYEPEIEARSRILSELKGSKEINEKRLGKDCPALCWPFGDYSGRSVELAQQAGYRLAFTTECGSIRPGSDRFSLPRYRMDRISGPRLALDLGLLKHPVLDRIINGKARSKKVTQDFAGSEKD